MQLELRLFVCVEWQYKLVTSCTLIGFYDFSDYLRFSDKYKKIRCLNFDFSGIYASQNFEVFFSAFSGIRKFYPVLPKRFWTEVDL